jgi:hypothetical protein
MDEWSEMEKDMEEDLVDAAGGDQRQVAINVTARTPGNHTQRKRTKQNKRRREKENQQSRPPAFT